MIGADLHRALIYAELGLALVTVIGLLFVVAPYGRHERAGWGPTVPARLGWIVMESPPVLVFAALYALGPHRAEPGALALLGLWMLHYVHRAYVYPFRMRASKRRMPLLVPALAIVFNVLNASVNAPQLSTYGRYGASWLADPRFVVGAALFVLGFVINVRADAVLFRLRKPGEGGYSIPTGALHERVASPNYFGELLEWTGWAVATWSLAGLAFAAYTAANLVPRAVAHLRWYRATFPDYPRERRAIVPFVL